MKTQITTTLLLTSLIVMSGCSDNKTKTKEPQTLPKISNQSKAFAQSITSGNTLFTMAQSMSSSSAGMKKIYKQQAKVTPETNTIQCEDGGSMEVTYSENNTTSSVDLNTKYDNCIEDTLSTNGQIKMTLRGQSYPENITFAYLSNFTFEDMEDNTGLVIKKDSNFAMQINSNGQDIATTENMDVNFKQGVNEEQYKSVALITYVKMTQKGEEFYFKSGKRYINNELYSVDDKYDASKTPMTVSEEGDLLKGGKMKFYNSSNHHITLESIAKNQLKVSVDIDNDGEEDESEILKVDE